jgi:xanthosine utilization system XapX-like protein
MSQKVKSILMRFVKGLISGVVTSMLMVTVSAPTNWTELKSVGIILIVSGVFGGINGLLLAIEKWASWEEVLPV